MSREQRLASTFVELADTLVEDFDVVDLLTLLAERCVELLDVAAAGVLLAGSTERLHLVGATSEAAETVELFQIQNSEGPCQDCFRSGEAVDTPDLADAGDRWPQFAPVAVAAGFRGAHAVPLRLRGQIVGVVGLFRAVPGSFSAEDLGTAQALADVASIAVIQSRALHDSHIVREQLQHALNDRVAIEQAKGIVAERLGCSVDDAFTILRTRARATSRRLSLVARDVVVGRVDPTHW